MEILICIPDKSKANLIEKRINLFFYEKAIRADIKVFSSGVDAAATDFAAQIALLDCSISDIDCITLGKIIKEKNSFTRLIFISDDYKRLDEAFSLGATRYLKKPFGEKRLLDGISECIKQINESTAFLNLKDDNSLIRVNKNEIIYIEIENRKTRVVTVKKTYYSAFPMKYWRETLSDRAFISPHKSFIVNTDYITEYKRNEYLILNGKYKVSIARSRAPEINKQIILLNTSSR